MDYVPDCVQEDTVDSRSHSELVTETQGGKKKKKKFIPFHLAKPSTAHGHTF